MPASFWITLESLSLENALLSTRPAREGEAMSPEERARILKESEPNSWIALSEDESCVVGRGATYGEAVDAAEKAGVPEPLIIRIPPTWGPMVLANCV